MQAAGGAQIIPHAPASDQGGSALARALDAAHNRATCSTDSPALAGAQPPIHPAMPPISSWLAAGPRNRLASAAALTLACACTAPAQAAPQTKSAERPEELINWYYSAAFGTGIYQSGDRNVAVLQLPLAYTLPTDDDARARLTLKLPVSFGFYDFDLTDIADGDLPESISTLSILPGFQAQVRINSSLEATPFAYAGYGWELNGHDSAFIYNLGVKSRWTSPLGENRRFMLGATLNHAAYRPDSGGGTRPLTQLTVGLSLSFPTNGTVKGVPADLGLHFIYYRYLTPLEYPVTQDVTNQLRAETEFAVSVGTRVPVPLGVFDRDLIDFDMIGIAFRVGDDVKAVRLFFSLPY